MVTGSLIQETAMLCASDLLVTDFKASNGRLSCFKSQHNIGCLKMSCESGSVDIKQQEQWLERVPQLLASYGERDIFNMDEISIYF